MGPSYRTRCGKADNGSNTNVICFNKNSFTLPLVKYLYYVSLIIEFCGIVSERAATGYFFVLVSVSYVHSVGRNVCSRMLSRSQKRLFCSVCFFIQKQAHTVVDTFSVTTVIKQEHYLLVTTTYSTTKTVIFLTYCKYFPRFIHVCISCLTPSGS